LEFTIFVTSDWLQVTSLFRLITSVAVAVAVSVAVALAQSQ